MSMASVDPGTETADCLMGSVMEGEVGTLDFMIFKFEDVLLEETDPGRADCETFLLGNG